jgi:polyisoprenoid-binding protein YceI
MRLELHTVFGALLLCALVTGPAVRAPVRADDVRVTARADDVRAIDTTHSKVAFALGHLYVTRVTGDLPITAGTVTVPADSLVPSAVNATLDPRRIKTGDDDRDGELQGTDWFDTKRFPAWTYRSTRIAPGPNGSFSVEGTLTVRGVGAPLLLTGTATGTPSKPLYHAVGHVDRHAFGMPPTRTDALVASDVEITLNVMLK